MSHHSFLERDHSLFINRDQGRRQSYFHLSVSRHTLFFFIIGELEGFGSTLIPTLQNDSRALNKGNFADIHQAPCSFLVSSYCASNFQANHVHLFQPPKSDGADVITDRNNCISTAELAAPCMRVCLPCPVESYGFAPDVFRRRMKSERITNAKEIGVRLLI